MLLTYLEVVEEGPDPASGAVEACVDDYFAGDCWTVSERLRDEKWAQSSASCFCVLRGGHTCKPGDAAVLEADAGSVQFGAATMDSPTVPSFRPFAGTSLSDSQFR